MRDPFEWLSTRDYERNKRAVGGPLPGYRLVLVPLGVVVGANIVYAFWLNTWIGWVTWILMSAAAGAWAGSGPRRALAYRRGYHDARREMFNGLREAQHRDMGFEAWYQAEVERDVAMHIGEAGT